ncbi:MAG: hypothetical protein COW19_09265 [Zetaproteobacteria bacterium CG12_big_fil_rev_8_21_14_0_65_55_1124]|nr:MAG: hypothetical protein AUJ58_10400 [Zetaproteobacteria bacterium CG1_02_55_237]PIS18440.1 MAG: hypothetical protein COT53_10655 [Zetaproteobacteria bacterium CG08_land_8_20_14_0_20_55_17]PIW42199.1 MAG: hypothetical protein COW19_09265 [Zetaproteobacteria bacterium CG12_big_fil_rev_8_21_14_0_65_55_1124]PIY53767.1 MAG: hypothetical protein COZ01_02550 [Zetaproteobacteria bacterium CG_4_10_14_0_8_um_filter_55_43]PIZ38460.1 MAG: hypothetical protein COY36_06020 [Zetaproteobacteria bacterium 
MSCLLTMICGAGSAFAGQMPPLFASIQNGDVSTLVRLADSNSVNQTLEMRDASFTPLGFTLAMLDSGMEKAERIIPLLLDHGVLATNRVVRF